MPQIPADAAAAFGPARAAGLAALCGAGLALAQPPLGWWPALVLAAPLVGLVDRAPGPRAAFLLGWACGAGHFAAALFWIVEPFLVDAPRHGWMAPFALLFMAGGLALFWGAGFAAARAVWPRRPSRVLVLALAWTLAEFARGHVLTGFPWGLAAYAWIGTPPAQLLALVGPWGLTLLTLAAALVPAAWSGRRALFGAGIAAVAVGLAWAWGAHRLAGPAPGREPSLTVRLVQPNARQELKWRPDMQAEFWRRHLEASRAPGAPDVVIWSESAAPFVLGYAPDLQAEAAAAAGGAPLILGIERFEPAGAAGGDGPEAERWFNALAVLGPDGEALAVYDKHRLVPFGEYAPLAGAIARLGIERLTTLTARGFSAGPGPATITAGGLPPFAPLICYEATFPALARGGGPRPDWLVQVTNDAWFGAVSGPWQHLAQARARAIEQGLPLARAANTGVSAMIDPFGRITAELGLGAQGFVDAALPAPLPPTPYARWGDWAFLVLILSVIGLTGSNFSIGLRRGGWG